MDTSLLPGPEPATEPSPTAETRSGDRCRSEDAILWRVIGGSSRGGIIVREGPALTSPQAVDRLATGSVVKQLWLENRRLHYECIEGSGPKFGWVSLHQNNTELLVRLDQTAAQPTSASLAKDGWTKHGWTKSLILFDWDDTLCPTSWIEADPELRSIPRGMQLQTRTGRVWDGLSALAKAVKELLYTAQSLGAVAIITLAERPWVLESAQVFLPEVSHVVEKLQVFYAREQPVATSKLGLHRFIAQKRFSMQKAMDAFSKKFTSGSWLSLLSIGDSPVEIAAAQELGTACRAQGVLKFTKTVKFRQRPQIEQLLVQVQLLSGKMAELVALENHRHTNVHDL